MIAKSNPQNKRILSLMILLISSIGFVTNIPIPGKQIFYLFIVLILNYKSIKQIPKRWANITTILALLYSLLFLLKGITIPWFVPVSMFTALICLSVYYRKHQLFLKDFKKLLNFFMYYHLVGVISILIFYPFFTTIFLDFAEYKTFLGLLWYNHHGGPSFFNDLRFTGIAWEVGIWQFFLNANLIFALKSNKNLTYIFLNIIAIITTFSTSAYFVLLFVLLMNFTIVNKVKIKQIISLGLIALLFFPLIKDNIQEKFTGENSGSGLTRVADLIIGLKILRDNPILGSDVDFATANNSSSEIWTLKKNLWNSNYTDGLFAGFMTVKNSNGFLRFMIDWGIPFSLFLLYKAGSSNLFNDKRLMFVFFSTLCFSMFSEAISRTAFFYFLILSGFFFNNNYSSQKSH